ncbi:MAG TPA: type III-A CRISPR-associated protein Cas10/Csm1 [Anaerolineales bacterium]|nr:type III-A CRISPR-associated protein Cas10/Csm1 [Anaerolineales bacterium]
MATRDEVYRDTLAGLLHDIGKFAQRAGVGKRELTDGAALAEVRHGHALYSDSFVQEYVPLPLRRGLTAPRRHHNPQSDQDCRVQLADWLSAGEREEEEEKGSSSIPYLLSIFARIGEHEAEAYLPLERLDPMGEGVFPRSGGQGDYAGLWREFTDECARLREETDLVAYLEGMAGLLQEFTWCVPSAWRTARPDISLYDHARTTAALTACLAADGRDGTWCREVIEGLRELPRGGTPSEAVDRPVAYLVSGDISGVQDYLYTIASGGAAKSLRGRSFYLQLLTEAAALRLLDVLGLPTVNLIYAGGGHFYLLAPTHEEAIRRLEEERQRIGKVLLDAHEGRLYLALGYIPVKAREFLQRSDAGFAQVWTRVGRAVARDKRRRFAALGAEQMVKVIGRPLTQGGHPDRFCLVCGREGNWREDKDGIRKCTFCRSLEELGNDLRSATHLVLRLASQPGEGPIAHWRDGLHAIGVAVQVIQKGTGQVRPSADGTGPVWVWRLRPDAERLRVETGAPVVQTWHPFALLAPRIWDPAQGRERVATFEELAEASSGVKRWGVLRMDVDDLGELFRVGLGESATLSRVASVSFYLRLFFEGHLLALASKYNEYDEKRRTGRDRVYVMYAGGDDLFIVGAWDVLPLLAYDIRQAFHNFVAGNPYITLSGGISLHPEKYPLYLAAAEAGEALESGAKEHRRPDDHKNGHKKDALAFLGTVIGWEEFEAVRQRTYNLVGWVDEKLEERALIQVLRRIAEEYRREREWRYRRGKLRPGTRYIGPWAWHLVYTVARRVERAKSQARKEKDARRKADYEQIATELRAMEKEVIDQGQIRTLGLAARWAELLSR